MKKQYVTLLFAIAALSFTGCTEKEPEINEKPPVDEPSPKPTDVRILVANEGQFTKGTASLTSITQEGTVTHDVFKAANGRTIGDVAQSIFELDENYYVTLNNSRKVEVFNTKTYKSVETIVTDENTIPAYICHLGGDSIAMSEKSELGLLTIIDTNHDKNNRNPIRRTIEIGSSDQMKVTAKKLFIGGNSLRVFDLGKINKNDMREVKGSDGASITVSGDSKIVEDKNGKLWVLSGSQKSGKLICIDPTTETVVSDVVIPNLDLGWFGARLDITPKGDSLFVNGTFNDKKAIFAFDIKTPTITTEPLFYISDDVSVVYNMAVSKENTIFICDVEYGSIARGKLHELNKKGEVLKTFEAGIFPQYIHFR